MPLSEEDILNLGKQVGREIAATSEDALSDSGVQAKIHLGAVVAKDALLNPEVAEMERFVPEDTDS